MNESVPTKKSGPAKYSIEVVGVVRDDSEATAIAEELQEMDALIGSLRVGNAELKRVLAESNAKSSALLNDRAELQYQVDDLQEQLKRSAARLDTIPNQQADLEATAKSQMARIADLEARIEVERSRLSHVTAWPTTPEIEVQPGHGMALEAVPNNLDPSCKIDGMILEFLHTHTDWHIAIEKVSTNYFQFGNPMNLKVFIKVVGDVVVARVGGGFCEVMKWLGEERLRFIEAQALGDGGKETPASRRVSRKLKSMRSTEFH